MVATTVVTTTVVTAAVVTTAMVATTVVTAAVVATTVVTAAVVAVVADGGLGSVSRSGCDCGSGHADRGTAGDENACRRNGEEMLQTSCSHDRYTSCSLIGPARGRTHAAVRGRHVEVQRGLRSRVRVGHHSPSQPPMEWASPTALRPLSL
ncbi:hypothetical protein [Streptomyces sp. NPDC004014]